MKTQFVLLSVVFLGACGSNASSSTTGSTTGSSTGSTTSSSGAGTCTVTFSGDATGTSSCELAMGEATHLIVSANDQTNNRTASITYEKTSNVTTATSYAATNSAADGRMVMTATLGDTFYAASETTTNCAGTLTALTKGPPTKGAGSGSCVLTNTSTGNATLTVAWTFSN